MNIGFDFNFRSLTSRKKIVIVLALLTGLLHLSYGLTSLYPIAGTYSYIFIANFLGNVFFVTILYFTTGLEDYHEIIRYAFVLFTMSSIIAYFWVYAPYGLINLLLPAGIFDKLLEVFLIFFILLDRPLEESQSQSQSHNLSTT